MSIDSDTKPDTCILVYMLNATERNAAVLLHSNTIELAVLAVVEDSDHRSYGLLEDLVSDATLHLLDKALAKFKGPRYGLAKFISTTCKFKTMDALKRVGHARADMRGDFDAMAGEVTAAPDTAAARAHEAARLDAAIATLTGAEQEIATGLRSGEPASVIGLRLGMSGATMTRRKRDVAGKLALSLAA